MILTGEQIQIAANRTTHPIELRDGEQRIATLDPQLLLSYIERGYEVHGTKRRIRYLRPAPPKTARRPDLPYMACWLNTQSATSWRYQDTPGIPA